MYYQRFTYVLPTYYQPFTQYSLPTFYPRITHVLPTYYPRITHILPTFTQYSLSTFYPRPRATYRESTWKLSQGSKNQILQQNVFWADRLMGVPSCSTSEMWPASSGIHSLCQFILERAGETCQEVLMSDV